MVYTSHVNNGLEVMKLTCSVSSESSFEFRYQSNLRICSTIAWKTFIKVTWIVEARISSDRYLSGF